MVNTNETQEVMVTTEEVKNEPVAKKPAKSSTRKPKKTSSVILETARGQYAYAEIVGLCESEFCKNHPDITVTDISIYINVHENRAYYVVNGEANGEYVDL